ncbi:hypothetical protein [Brucella intermedia]|uniref:hypothetical protein n=1 Tax=Brucella intermedia TaxID=94625 RepID=UPI00124DC8E0|nr:hypothetical protein [Brucella intermedia]KAB2727604.1 hypothetical protein F9L02_17255 [Brucella intermedia]
MAITNVSFEFDTDPTKTKVFWVDDLGSSPINITVNLTSNGDGTDDPVPGDNYQFNFTANTKGTVTPATITAPIAQVGSSTTYTATAQVTPTTYGVCKATGNKDGDAAKWNANAASFSIQSLNQNFVTKKDFTQALPVQPTPAKPDDKNGQTSWTLQLIDDKNNAIPEAQITYSIFNTRTDATQQTGAFYDSKQKPLTPQFEQTSGAKSTGTVFQKTDDNGMATLYVGANKNAGLISISASSGSEVIDGKRVYIYDTLPSYDLDLDTPSTDIGPDVSTYPDPKFPVNVFNRSAVSGEFVGVFLNGTKFQGDVTGAEALAGSGQVLANISDLISSADGTDTKNILAGYRTSAGDLYKSLNRVFYINSPLPVPTPSHQILGPMVNPPQANGTINYGSIHAPDDTPLNYTTIINIKKDKDTLKTQLNYDLLAGDAISLTVRFEGDYVAGDEFKTFDNTYPPVPLGAPDLDKTDYQIIIPYSDITGYGTPKEQGKRNRYTMYYTITSAADPSNNASSFLSIGTLSTRRI